MLTSLQRLKKKLEKVEKQLEKVRGCSPLTDGWQTQRFAKKSRKWDMLAQERMKLINEIDLLNNEIIVIDDSYKQPKSDEERLKSIEWFDKIIKKRKIDNNTPTLIIKSRLHKKHI